MHTPHVDALQTKHAGLDARLRAEMARPAPDVPPTAPRRYFAQPGERT